MRDRASRAGVAACIALVGVLLSCSACGAEKIPPLQSDLVLAERFRPFALFHAGTRIGGLPMTNDGSRAVRHYRRGGYVAFMYGQCIPWGEHNSCNPPVDIINYPICYFPGPQPSPQRVMRIRGARATVHFDYGAFDAVEVRTGSTTVVVHADSPAQALRIVHRLRAPNRRISVRDPLPPPRRVTPSLSRALCARG